MASPVPGVKAGWSTVTTPEGLRLEATVGTVQRRWGDPLQVELVLENTHHEAMEVHAAMLDHRSHALALDVKFEDGYPCEVRGQRQISYKRQASTVTLEAGGRRVLSFDIARKARMNWVGTYRCRLGVDPDLTGGKSPRTMWLDGAVVVTVLPPDEEAVGSMLKLIPEGLPWNRYEPFVLESMSDSGSESLLPRFRALRGRVESDRRQGIEIPRMVKDEVLIAEEKIELFGCVRRGEWAKVVEYVRSGPIGPHGSDPFKNFLSLAYQSHLSR